MIKFSKMFFTNPAKIWISTIKCSFNNVVKIIKVFNCEWMTMTIDSIAEGSALLTLEELTATGVTDACISIALDEDAILICMNKSRYSSKDVFQAIKSLHFEQNSLGSFQPHT